MRKSISVRLYLRVAKTTEDGKIPIYARIIVGREKFELSTKQHVDNADDWDEVTQRIKRKCPANTTLSEIEHEINEAHRFLKYNDRPITINAIRDQLKGPKRQNDQLRLIDFINDYYDKQVVPNNDYTKATKTIYKVTQKHLVDFLESTGKTTVLVKEIDQTLIRKLDHFLYNGNDKIKLKLKKNSVNKYHVKFKVMINHAIDIKLLDRNPYKGFKLKSEPGSLTFLSQMELKKLEEHKLGNNESLIRVRDVFMFSVYTGLRFSDAISLKTNHLEEEENGYWICYTQQKTQDANRIPALSKAVKIIKKYENERKATGFVLPRITNQKLNAYLKVIADMVGISKKLTHHVARHTAATTIFLQNGVSLEVTSKQLGHRSLKSTQIYAKVTNLMLKNTADLLNKIV